MLSAYAGVASFNFSLEPSLAVKRPYRKMVNRIYLVAPDPTELAELAELAELDLCYCAHLRRTYVHARPGPASPTVLLVRIGFGATHSDSETQIQRLKRDH